MALTINTSITNSITAETLAVNGLAVNPARPYQQSGTINVGSTEETITLSADFTEPGYAMIINLSTNQHSVRIGSGIVLTGDHTGANNASVLTDSKAEFPSSGLIGLTILNVTDNSTGVITANATQTVTATLSGGTDNDWDTGDEYEISTYWASLEPGYSLILPFHPSVQKLTMAAAAEAINGVDVHYKIFNTA